MKPIIGTVILLLGISFIQSEPYTCEMLVNAGMKHSKVIQQVEEELIKAKAQVDEAHGEAMPSLDLSANYQYAFESYSPLGSAGIDDTAAFYQNIRNAYANTANAIPDLALRNQVLVTGPLMTGVTLGQLGPLMEPRDQALSLSLTLHQPLFLQGKIGRRVQIQKAYAKGLKVKYEMVQDTVRASITKLFYSALLAQKNAVTQVEAVKLGQEQHRLTVVRFAAGKSSELDTLVSRLAYEKSMMEQKNAESRMRVSYDALIKQAGIPETYKSLRIEGEFPVEKYTLSLEETQERMRAQNPALKQIQTGSDVQAHLVKMAQSDFYPRVFCGASMGKIYQFNEFGEIDWSSAEADDQKVFVGATVNLFSGLKNTSRLKQARADQHAFKKMQELTADALEVGLLSSYEKMENSQAQLETAQTLLTLAEKGYSMSKAAYEAGALTLADFQKRQLELEEAKMAMNASRFAFHCAVVDLKLMTGEF